MNVENRGKRWRSAAVLIAALVLPSGAQAQAPSDTLWLDADGAVKFALRNGVEAAIARQEVLAAQAGVGVARSYALPQLDATASYLRNIKKPLFFVGVDGETQAFEIGRDNAWLAALGLRQTIFASGRVSSGYKMAKDRALAAQWAGDDMAAIIAREIKRAYYVVLLAGEQTEIAEKSLEQAEKNVAQISGRVERGVTPEFDRLRAEVTVENRKPIVTRARNQEQIALESLKRGLNVPLDRPVVLVDSLAYTLYVETLDEVMKRALDTRRDLAAARAEASAARHQAKAQGADDMPLLYLDGNLRWQGENSNGLLPEGQEQITSADIGITFAWPVFDGLRNKHKTRAANAQAHAAGLQVKLVSDFVRLEVRSSYSEVESIAEEIVGAERAVEVAREAYQIAQVRYRTGMSRLIELLDSELALIQAALNLSETLYRYNVALAELEYSIGEGPKLGAENKEGK